jgi:hypothetical protein
MTTYKKKGILIAPESYWQAPYKERRRICNGCGLNGWKGKLVPENIYGVSIKEACNIHDWMYHHGASMADRETADDLFLENMLSLINNQGGWISWLRRYRAVSYYNAVVEFGDDAFNS